jgi:hypothetical protein
MIIDGESNASGWERTLWKVKDVMSYFSEWVRDEEEADEIMREVEREGWNRSMGYGEIMREFRQKLLDRGFEVPFMCGFRRCKDD